MCVFLFLYAHEELSGLKGMKECDDGSSERRKKRLVGSRDGGWCDYVCEAEGYTAACESHKTTSCPAIGRGALSHQAGGDVVAIARSW